MSIIFAIIIFSLLILIHEFGHFLIAKKNGVCVTEFSLGMGPRILKKQVGETLYSWKLFPFGGSCMMLGEDEEGTEDDPRSFQSKSVWARIAVVAAGPVFNFLLAIVLSVVVIGCVGIDKPTVLSVTEGMPAYEAGLREGDVVTSYDGSGVSIGREIYLQEVVNPMSDETIIITYKRDGVKYTAEVTPELVQKYMLGMTYSTADDASVTVSEGGALEAAGLQDGDVITAINGTAIADGLAMSEYLAENPIGAETMSVTYLRDGEETTVEVTPVLTESYSIGWSYNLYREKVGPLATIGYSFLEFKYDVKSVFKSLGMLFTGKLTANDVSGPVGIVDMIGDTYEETKSDGWYYVLLTMANLTVLLSANLGVMNLLPIPALDGGRLVFLIIEAVVGKPVPRDKEAIVHMIGMILLLILMVLIMFNDIWKLFS
ncbi:MAG: RIP metalloprotease RseP [Lachnospiraceae bacterium]|nr:RIP metalloprotease RseP [Lachnospiraceae bacterium]